MNSICHKYLTEPHSMEILFPLNLQMDQSVYLILVCKEIKFALIIWLHKLPHEWLCNASAY